MCPFRNKCPHSEFTGASCRLKYDVIFVALTFYISLEFRNFSRPGTLATQSRELTLLWMGERRFGIYLPEWAIVPYSGSERNIESGIAHFRRLYSGR